MAWHRDTDYLHLELPLQVRFSFRDGDRVYARGDVFDPTGQPIKKVERLFRIGKIFHPGGAEKSLPSAATALKAPPAERVVAAPTSKRAPRAPKTPTGAF